MCLVPLSRPVEVGGTIRIKCQQSNNLIAIFHLRFSQIVYCVVVWTQQLTCCEEGLSLDTILKQIKWI